MSFSDRPTATTQAGTDGAGRDGGLGAEPIVLLTFPYSGVEVLRDMISSRPGVVCTSRTGVIPLCHAAAATWENIDPQGKALSPVAAASIRSLASLMLVVLAADSGVRRWCETVVSGTPVAETFLRVFPGTRFVCFYRRCDDVIADVLAKNLYGLGDTEFWGHSLSWQGNSVAGIAAYWTERVQSLLDFEAAHPRACTRARLEDLQSGGGNSHAADALSDFLALPSADGAGSPTLPSSGAPAGAPTAMPAARIPAGLRRRVNELHSVLGYPTLLRPAPKPLGTRAACRPQAQHTLRQPPEHRIASAPIVMTVACFTLFGRLRNRSGRQVHDGCSRSRRSAGITSGRGWGCGRWPASTTCTAVPGRTWPGLTW